MCVWEFYGYFSFESIRLFACHITNWRKQRLCRIVFEISFFFLFCFFFSPICDLFVAFGICVKVIYRKIIINGNQEKNIYTVLYCTHIYHKTGLQCISPLSNISIEHLRCDESFWCFLPPTHTLSVSFKISTRNLFIIRLFYFALFALSFDLFIYSDMYLLYN